jgi:hypothetical protein
MSWAGLWAAHGAREAPEPAAERPPLGPDDPQADWESPEAYFARVAASTPTPAPRRSRPKEAPDAAK